MKGALSFDETCLNEMELTFALFETKKLCKFETLGQSIKYESISSFANGKKLFFKAKKKI